MSHPEAKPRETFTDRDETVTQAPPPRKSFEEFLAAVPEAPSSSKEAPAAEDPKAAAETSSSTAPVAEKEPSAQPAAGASTAAETDPVEAIRAALRAGDLDALADAVGEDPALYSEKSTKWAAARRKERKLKDERDRVAAQAEGIVKRWAPVSEAAQAVQNGEFVKFVELAEALTGMDYDALVLKVARARHGSDPQVEVLKKRLAEVEPVVQERAQAKASAAERAFLETLRDDVASTHKVREFEGWEAKVAAVLKESMDEDLGEPTLSPKQAADRVLRREREEFELLAKVFGVTPAAKPAKAARAPERASGAAPAGVRKMTREEWLAAQK